MELRHFILIVLVFTLELTILKSFQSFKILKTEVKISKKIDGLKLKTQGPNCWNGALIKSGINQSVRFVSRSEYLFWMKSPYCRELEANEKLQSGDLGSLFYNQNDLYHSFVYIDKEKVFSKNSPDSKFPYQYQKFEDMFFKESQSLAKKCWSNIIQNRRLKCDYKVMFHRCEPIEDNLFQLEKDISKIDAKIKSLEEHVYAWISGDTKITKELYSNTVVSLYRYLLELQNLEKTKLSDHRKFIINALEFRVLGLILSDIEISLKIPSLFPIVNYAYQVQANKYVNNKIF